MKRSIEATDAAVDTTNTAPSDAPAKPHKAKGDAPKAKGPHKPRAVDPAKLDQFGFRTSSTKSKAAALYARKDGATLGEVKAALHSTQFNLLTELRGKGFSIGEEKEDGAGNRKVTRYFIQSN